MASHKLQTRQQSVNSLLCVGLDSDIDKIPDTFRSSQTPQFDFNKAIIEATHPYVCAYKPNLAFYEARGTQGITELKLTLEYLQEKYPDIWTIADAKRADIGNTNIGYVKNVFDWLGFDAVTLHPYLGREALAPFLERTDKTSIILCRTSNPGAGELQDLLVDGKPMWEVVAKKVNAEWNSQGNCMLVMGATYPAEMKVVRQLCPQMTFLVPGIGVQGGDVKATVTAGKTAQGDGLIIAVSRSVIFAADPGKEAKDMMASINQWR